MFEETAPGRERPSQPVPKVSESPSSQGPIRGWDVSTSENSATFLNLKTLKGARRRDWGYYNPMFRFCVVSLKKFVIPTGHKITLRYLDICVS